jgi:hypothetical protein
MNIKTRNFILLKVFYFFLILDWEDRKLGNYLYSETRFEEILDNICGDDSEVIILIGILNVFGFL